MKMLYKKPGKILAVCVGASKHFPKKAHRSVYLRKGYGFVGDAHAGSGHRQVSLLTKESIEKIRLKKIKVRPGIFGENLVIRGLPLADLKLKTKLRLGKKAIIQITQLGKKCHKPCSIYYSAGFCIMPKEGVFAKVVCSGRIKVGDKIMVFPLPLREGEGEG